MCGTHIVPPAFLHSSIAFRSASLWSAEVAKPVKSRSAASAPHVLLKAGRSTHALPRLEQMSMASFSALARSALPCEYPAPISLLLYAMAPQDTLFGGGGALGGAELAPAAEQTAASTAQFFRPVRTHSAIARCWALSLVFEVPQKTVSPSTATAPHEWLKLASTRHLPPPCFAHSCNATLPAVALSSCSNDHPETFSFRLYAIAPQELLALPWHWIWQSWGILLQAAGSLTDRPLQHPDLCMQSKNQSAPAAVEGKVGGTTELTESRIRTLPSCFIRSANGSR